MVYHQYVFFYESSNLQRQKITLDILYLKKIPVSIFKFYTKVNGLHSSYGHLTMGLQTQDNGHLY